MAKGACIGCGKHTERGSVCDDCSVCRCGSGKPPGLCHRIAKSGNVVYATSYRCVTPGCGKWGGWKEMVFHAALTGHRSP